MPFHVIRAPSTTNTTWTYTLATLPKNSRIYKVVPFLGVTTITKVSRLVLGHYTADPGYDVPQVDFVHVDALSAIATYHAQFTQMCNCLVADGKLTWISYQASGGALSVSCTIWFEVES